MASSEQPTVEQLFERWRKGDAQAGQAMAQRFSDWFYAIAVCRLGDRHGRPPLERACRNFIEGIPKITDSRRLVPWAHNLVLQEVESAGNRLRGGDFPNALTGNRSPGALLCKARDGLDKAHVRLLAAAYGAGGRKHAFPREPEGPDGTGTTLIEARYALKRWLKENVRVPFGVVPATWDADRKPVPLYEALLLASDDEEMAFERWLLSDQEVCKDVAEFAAFALALKDGAFEEAGPAPAPRRVPARAPADLEGLDEPEEGEKKGLGTAALVGLVVLGGVAFVVLALAVVGLLVWLSR